MTSPLPLTGSSQLWARLFPYLYPSTPVLGITSTLYAYEDGTDRKFRNVGTGSSDAGRLPKNHNTARYKLYCNSKSDYTIEPQNIVPCLYVHTSSEDEPSGSKHVEDFFKKKSKILIWRMWLFFFFGLYCPMTSDINTFLFYAHSKNHEKRLSYSCPSTRTHQLGSHLAEFHEIWHLRIFLKYVKKGGASFIIICQE